MPSGRSRGRVDWSTSRLDCESNGERPFERYHQEYAESGRSSDSGSHQRDADELMGDHLEEPTSDADAELARAT
jgi:hypothetical protein